MLRRRLYNLLFLLFIGGSSLQATHIAGGYFTYQCLGLNADNTVSYTLRIYYYRDCETGSIAAREDSLNVSIYTATSVPVDVVELRPISYRNLALNDNFNLDCLILPTNICYEEEIFEGTIRLLANREHIISYQRCCRNSAVTNLVLSGDQGATYTTTIPAFNQVSCNTSPTFGNAPPTLLCLNEKLNIDLSATDVDGDSLVYSLCAPYGYSGSNVWPFQATPPPYGLVSYSDAFNAFLPIKATPSLQIDPSSAMLTGTPDSIGLYVIGFCVEEYRNGRLLNVVRRDIQVNIIDCTTEAEAMIQNQNINGVASSKALCQGLSIEFKNLSEVYTPTESYKWDFGVPLSLSDTSRVKNPTFTYPAPGKYTVTLMANPGTSCGDTITQDFYAYPKLNPSLEYFGDHCFKTNSFSFFVAGEKEDYATYEWEFFGNALQNQSTEDTVYSQRFLRSGDLPVQLRVKQDVCVDTLLKQVSVFNNPIASFTQNVDTGCFPIDIQFINNSYVEGGATYLWEFGDGTKSTEANPVHTYLQNGEFDVSLVVTTVDKCIDTVSTLKTQAIAISPKYSSNEIAFSLKPSTICLSEKVSFIDESNYVGVGEYYWDFGDGTISNEVNPSHTYTDTGSFFVSLMIVTSDKCAETLLDSLPNGVKVNAIPKSLFRISADSLSAKHSNVQIQNENKEPNAISTFYIQNRSFSNVNSLSYTFQDTGHFSIMQVIENQFNCKDTSYKPVFIYDVFELHIPNVFTPNNDGINDYFQVEACGVYGFKLEVFNRLGVAVFNSQQLANSWDGRIRGRKANDGVYFYKLQLVDFRGKTLNYNGTVTLINN